MSQSDTKRAKKWNDMYLRARTYYKKYGHTSVNNNNDEENPRDLKYWISNQKKWLNSKDTNIILFKKEDANRNCDRLTSLNEIGINGNVNIIKDYPSKDINNKAALVERIDQQIQILKIAYQEDYIQILKGRAKKRIDEMNTEKIRLRETMSLVSEDEGLKIENELRDKRRNFAKDFPF
jgi:hypothetical protein